MEEFIPTEVRFRLILLQLLLVVSVGFTGGDVLADLGTGGVGSGAGTGVGANDDEMFELQADITGFSRAQEDGNSQTSLKFAKKFKTDIIALKAKGVKVDAAFANIETMAPKDVAAALTKLRKQHANDPSQVAGDTWFRRAFSACIIAAALTSCHLDVSSYDMPDAEDLEPRRIIHVK